MQACLRDLERVIGCRTVADVCSELADIYVLCTQAGNNFVNDSFRVRLDIAAQYPDKVARRIGYDVDAQAS